MPELPEVETIKNTLIPLLKDKKILKIEVKRKATILGDSNKFISTLTNEIFKDVTRKGKFLIFHLTNNNVFISHLRMEGKYFLLNKNEESKYPKVIFHLNTNEKLVFDDMRCFGIIKLSNENNYLNEKELSSLGQEPWDIKDIDSFIKKASKRKDEIKSAILDQTLISGLGNIYADETLFKSQINPNKPAKLLSKKDWIFLINNASKIMKEAINNKGSTIRTYKITKDHAGSMQDKLLIYGKHGQNCPNCGRKIRFCKVNGRGTSYCPDCQKHDFLPINIALTGTTGSGKSLILKQMKDQDLYVISSDEIVHELYKKKEVISFINNLFNLEMKNEVDRELIRDVILKDKNLKIKLEKYIHGLVIEYIKEEMKKPYPIKVFEVPLLFEAKMQNMFDEVIIVTSKNAKEHLISRVGEEKALKLLEINSKAECLKHFDEADVIINNDYDKLRLEILVNVLINKWKHYQN